MRRQAAFHGLPAPAQDHIHGVPGPDDGQLGARARERTSRSIFKLAGTRPAFIPCVLHAEADASVLTAPCLLPGDALEGRTGRGSGCSGGPVGAGANRQCADHETCEDKP